MKPLLSNIVSLFELLNNLKNVSSSEYGKKKYLKLGLYLKRNTFFCKYTFKKMRECIYLNRTKPKYSFTTNF